MAKNQQTHAKRARELALKERRERKQAKKAERAAGGSSSTADGGGGAAEGEGDSGTTSRWIQ
jgi:hypothetical protein